MIKLNNNESNMSVTKKRVSVQKIPRNILFFGLRLRIMGIGLFFTGLFLGSIFNISRHGNAWFLIIAVIAFGLSWGIYLRVLFDNKGDY